MNDEQREAIRAAAKRRGNCPRCGASVGSIQERDGKDVGGVPGITYRCCAGCGWTQAKTRRQRKFKL